MTTHEQDAYETRSVAVSQPLDSRSKLIQRAASPGTKSRGVLAVPQDPSGRTMNHAFLTRLGGFSRFRDWRSGGRSR